MSVGNFKKCLKEILRWEGGFSNHPSDIGGVTNRGVTKATYEHWVGHPVSIDVMRGLTEADVEPIYKKLFWDKLQCEHLPLGIDLCVFDFGVNAGTGRAAPMLQKLIGAKADGIIGPKTIQLVKDGVAKGGAKDLIAAFQQARRDYYRRLSTFSVFGKGWIRRVNDIEQKAIKMLGAN